MIITEITNKIFNTNYDANINVILTIKKKLKKNFFKKVYV